MPADTAAIIRRDAEKAAAALPAIQVAAERVAATIMQGVHGRRRVGQGDTFWQFRPYQQGDTVQRIDWRQTARRTQAFIRENEWEIAQSVWIWLDRSPSMDFKSNRDLPVKSWRAAVLTLALGSLLVQAGERIALMGTDMPPISNRPALDRMADILGRPPAAEAEALPPSADLPRYAHIVIISDFLSPPEEIEKSIRWYATQGIRGHLLQIFDPAEQTLPFSGRIRFDGLEGEGSLMIGRVETVRSEFNKLMANHRAAVASIAQASGWSCTNHGTDHPPETALLALFNAIGEQGELRRHA